MSYENYQRHNSSHSPGKGSRNCQPEKYRGFSDPYGLTLNHNPQPVAVPGRRKSKPSPYAANYQPRNVPAVSASDGYANSAGSSQRQYGPSNPHNLTDREKSEGGGCLMFLVCIVLALGLYVSDASVSVEVHKKPAPISKPLIHKE